MLHFVRNNGLAHPEKCCSARQVNMGLAVSTLEGFKSGVDSFMLRQVSSDLPKETTVVVIKVLSGKNLAVSSQNQYHISNPYVEMSLQPGDRDLGDQTQRTSYRPSTYDPLWQSPESFQFATSNNNAKISFFVYSLRTFSHISSITSCVLNDDEKSRRIPVGVAHLNIKDIPCGTVTNYTLRLTNIDDGSISGGQLNLRVERTTLSRAVSYREDIVYEYERWQPIMEWGNEYPGHLLPTDPGRWSSGDGSKFADSFDELVSPIPPDWTVLTPFSVSGGPSAWSYAVDFSYSDWYSDMTAHTFVRRRMWRREVANPTLYSIYSCDNTSHLSSRLVMVGDISGHDDTDHSDMDDSRRASERKQDSLNKQPHVKNEIEDRTEEKQSLSSSERSTPPMLELPVLLCEEVSVSSGGASSVVLSLLLSSASFSQTQTDLQTISSQHGVQSIGLDESFGDGVLKMSLSVGDRDVMKLLRCASFLSSGDSHEAQVVPAFCIVEISALSLSELANREISGKQDPYTVFTFPWVEDEEKKVLQTSVHDDAGDCSHWDSLQIISASPFKVAEEGSGHEQVVKIKVMERNVHSKDKLIGKASLVIPEKAVPGEWMDLSGELRDNHNEASGRFSVTLRLVHVSAPVEATKVTVATDAIVFRCNDISREDVVKNLPFKSGLAVEKRVLQGRGATGEVWMVVSDSTLEPLGSETRLKAMLDMLVSGAISAQKTLKPITGVD